jgi:hypothetical protein
MVTRLTARLRRVFRRSDRAERQAALMHWTDPNLGGSEPGWLRKPPPER